MCLILLEAALAEIFDMLQKQSNDIFFVTGTVSLIHDCNGEQRLGLLIEEPNADLSC